MLADAFGQAALQHFQRVHFFVIVMASRDPVARLAALSKRAVAIFFHDISSFYRSLAAIWLI